MNAPGTAIRAKIGSFDRVSVKEEHGNQLALVAQRIEHLTTDQKVRGSNPFKRT